MEPIQQLEEKITRIETKIEQMVENFNILIDKLNNAELKTITTFDELEINEENYDEPDELQETNDDVY